jgi:hypothetical protein
MHCEGQILVWDVYTLLFLIWWERIVSTRGYIDRRNDNALVLGCFDILHFYSCSMIAFVNI